MSPRDLEALKFRLNAIMEQHARLGEREYEFVVEILRKVDRYRADLRVTIRQSEWLDRIYDRLYPSGKEDTREAERRRDEARAKDDRRRKYSDW